MPARTDDPELGSLMVPQQGECLCEGRANISHIGVLMGGRPGSEYLKPSQSGSEAELSPIPVMSCSRIIHHTIYSPFICDTGLPCLSQQTMALQML